VNVSGAGKERNDERKGERGTCMHGKQAVGSGFQYNCSLRMMNQEWSKNNKAGRGFLSSISSEVLPDPYRRSKYTLRRERSLFKYLFSFPCEKQESENMIVAQRGKRMKQGIRG
jgi:hypothetical protein